MNLINSTKDNKNLSLLKRVYDFCTNVSVKRFDVFFVRFILVLVVFQLSVFLFYEFVGTESVIKFWDSVDKQIMLSLNHDCGKITDMFWYMLSSKYSSIPLIVALIFSFFQFKVRFNEALLIVVSLVIVIALCDMISSSIIKPYVARFRPTRASDFCEFIHCVNGYRGGRYGFVSSHAANACGTFTYLALVFRRRAIILPMAVWMVCVCYSRIYLGVHYPGDILFGCILGVTIGGCVYYTVRYIYISRLARLFKVDCYTQSMSKQFVVLNVSIWGTFLFIMCYSLLVNLW